MALPAAISYCKITGLFLEATADTLDDEDELPQGNPLVGAQITFRAAPSAIKTSDPAATTIPRVIECLTDASGYIYNPAGTTLDESGNAAKRGVRILASDDPDIEPHDWSWSFAVKRADLPTISGSFIAHADGEIDLATVVNVPASPGAETAAWIQAVSAATDARDAAQAAASDAAGSAAAAEAARDLAVEAAAHPSDPAVAALIDDPDSQVRASLSSTYAAGVSLPAANGVDDTAAIQAVLTAAAGKRIVGVPGSSYRLSAALIISSGTTLDMTTCTVTLLDDVNCRMVENAHKTTQAALTRIDRDITIRGGVWDGNGTNQSKKWDGDAYTTSIMSGFLFSGVENLTFCPAKIVNTRAYAALICNVSNLVMTDFDVSVGNISAPDNVDGIHILGPAEGVFLRHGSVKSEDNAIAINADDVGHGPYGTFGDITNVRIKDIVLNNDDGAQGMLLLSASHSIKDVLVEDISGSAAYLMNISTFDMGVGDYDDIVIRRVNLIRSDPAFHQFVMMRGVCGSITLEDFKIRGNENTISGTRFLSAFTTAGTPITSIKNLTIRNIEANDNGAGTGWFDLVCLYEGVTVANLDIAGLKSKDNPFVCKPVHLEPVTVTNLTISDVDVDHADNGLMDTSGATVTNLRADRIVLDDAQLSDTQEAWIDPTLINGWVNLGAAYGTAGYYKSADGIVHLKGLIQGGEVGSIAFVLPPGYRPAAAAYFPGLSGAGVLGRIIVDGAGGVAIDGFSSWIALDSCSFRPA